MGQDSARASASSNGTCVAIDGESVLDLMQIPNRDVLKARFKELQAGRAKAAEEDKQIRLITGKKAPAGKKAAASA